MLPSAAVRHAGALPLPICALPLPSLPACPLCVCRERGKLWDPASKQRWGHDAFESLERGEEPAQDDYLQEVRRSWLLAS